MVLLSAQALKHFSGIGALARTKNLASVVPGTSAGKASVASSLLKAARTPINRLPPVSFLPTLPGAPPVTPPIARRGFRSRVVVAPIKVGGPTTEDTSDTLNLSSITIDAGNEIVGEYTNGLSEQRPEIISLMKMQPLYTGDPEKGILSPQGRLIEVNYQVGVLQDDIIKTFLNDMSEYFGDSSEKETAAEKKFLRATKARHKELNSISDSLSLFSELDFTTHRFKRKLNPKNIGRGKYQTDNYYSIKPFFVERMQFKEDQWAKFSGTKVFLQLLSDFRHTAINYSFNLLDITDADRSRDYSPFEIDRSYGGRVTEKNNFTLSGFTSGTGQLKLASNFVNFHRFVQKLPASKTQRVTALCHLLGKEISVSTNLTPGKLESYKEEFGVQDSGNPFDSIIGLPGATVFDSPRGSESLAALAHIPVESNTKLKVLPFERKIVDVGKEEASYIPGWQFFTDKLYQIKTGENPSFNKKDVRDYTDEFSSKILSANAFTWKLLNLDEGVDGNGVRLYKEALGQFEKSQNKFKNNSSQPLMHAIFRMATTDIKLKKMLFEFCVFVGLSMETKASVDGTTSEMFQDLALEYDSLSNFETIKGEAVHIGLAGRNISLIDNPNLDYSYWSNLFAKKIRNHIYKQYKVPRRGLKLETVFVSDAGADVPVPKTVGELEDIAWHWYTGSQKVTFRRGEDFYENLKTVAAEPITGGHNQTLVNSIIGFARAVSTQGHNNDFNWTLDDGRTRFNQLSPSFQFLMVFEIFCALTELYGHSEFEKHSDKKRLTINSNTRVAQDTNEILKNARQGVNTNNLSSYKPEAKKKRGNRDYEISTGTSLNSRHNGINDSVPNDGIWSVTLKANSTNGTVGGALFNPGACGVTVKSSSPTTTSYPTAKWTSGTGWSGLGLGGVPAPLHGFSFTGNYSWGSGLYGGSFASALGWGKNFSIYGSYNPFAWKTSSGTGGTSYSLNSSKVTQELTATIQKLEAEEAYLANINYLLKLFRVRMQESWEMVDSAFSNAKLNQLIEQSKILFDDEIATTTSKTLRNLKNPAQLQTAAYNHKLYSGKLAKQTGQDLNSFTAKENVFLASESIDITQRDALYKLLQYSKFNKSKAKNLYLLSVGLPKNSVNFWKSRATVDTITELEGADAPSLFAQKQSDILKVKVYKRLLRYPDIVFEPQEFLFDSSLFVLPEDVANAKPNYLKSKDELFKTLQVSDFSTLRKAEHFSINKYNPRKLTTQNIVRNKGYDGIGLKNADKRELVTNQITSYLLSLYIRLATGVNITENTFAFNEVTEVGADKNFADSLISYMRDVLGEPIEADITTRPNRENTIEIRDLINDENISEDSREILSIVLRGNAMHKKGYLTNKILAPKMFDRVFHIPVDMDDFVVDVDETNSTVPGQAAYIQSTNQGLFEQRSDGRVYFVGANKIGEGQTTGNKEVIFDDLFITIESLA